MKSKYYPHVTILAAAAMVIVPLCFVLSLPYLRVEPISHDAPMFADLDDTAATPLDTRVAAVAKNESRQSAEPVMEEMQRVTVAASESPAAAAISPAVTTPAAIAPTRVAMLPAHKSTTIPDAPQPSPNEAAPHSIPPTILDTDAVLDMATIREESIDLTANSAQDGVPVPDIEKRSAAAPIPSTPIAARPPLHSISIDEEPTLPDPHASPEYAASQVKAPSYFDATGHLSMAGGALGAIAGTTPPANTGSPPADARPGTDDSSTKSKSSAREPYRRRSTGRSSRSRASETKKDATRPDETPIQGFDSPWVLPGDGFGSKPNIKIVDVILQQPLEARRVSRMENVVAVSRERGWPIALVKSDLPDDHWWVQQMVGVRGNAFAARVNFGNEYSIPGSVYHMVIVFLDSPDEVRRFRIAKQFDELPEGVRHSREFTFVRK